MYRRQRWLAADKVQSICTSALGRFALSHNPCHPLLYSLFCPPRFSFQRGSPIMVNRAGKSRYHACNSGFPSLLTQTKQGPATWVPMLLNLLFLSRLLSC
ncbi:Uncharacterized protein HZ326_16237 [Fusarium oxysporum f. sp. albedinis]|nr:Uncharacterized protein HZ326_16237 [Fusarium oxysporum f. sp. albedinis]